MPHEAQGWHPARARWGRDRQVGGPKEDTRRPKSKAQSVPDDADDARWRRLSTQIRHFMMKDFERHPLQ